ncbi:hypothetical protein XELAEV_18028361mg [Xenopus laevis]|uniref:Uncharacterized protein n=1 Tax=Xenopus laevis TaxID=8355 RepID=A0A974CY65_XENLA|nr:hypothetical protein XELAEV_18028361mg [Xenopus laevis]
MMEILADDLAYEVPALVQSNSSETCDVKHTDKMETSQYFISPDLFASMKAGKGEDCEFAGGEAAQSKPSKQSGAEYAAAALHHAADMQSPMADFGGGMAASKPSPERHQAPHALDQTPTTDELVELLKVANKQELQWKKMKVELQKAFHDYTTAAVEKQDFYLAKVNKINEELRTRAGPIKCGAQLGPCWRRFEDSRQDFKQPAKYRSMSNYLAFTYESDAISCRLQNLNSYGLPFWQ